MPTNADPFYGKVITIPDGPWAGRRVRILGRVMRPMPYYQLQRLDTGEIGHRDWFKVVMLALEQGVMMPGKSNADG